MQMTFTKLPKSITAEELLSTPLPPVKWIVPGLLPAGLALFAGPSKAGKSWLTLWLCLQIAQGNPVWNREIEPRTVIYFSLEDTFNRLQNRIFQLIDGGDAPERLILQTECPSIGQGLEEQVEALVHTYQDVGLIVIDTLQKVRVSDGNGGMYANDYKEAGALKKLADKYGICILLIRRVQTKSGYCLPADWRHPACKAASHDPRGNVRGTAQASGAWWKLHQGNYCGEISRNSFLGAGRCQEK